MSDPQNPNPDEGWKDIGQGRAPHAGNGGAAATPMDFTPEEKIYGVRRSTPPGTISLRVGGVAFLLMTAFFVFTDVRDVDTPLQHTLPLVYALCLVPALGVLWGLIGLVKRAPDDAPRAAIGLVLSLAAFGIAYAAVTSTLPRHETAPVVNNDRVGLPPKDLAQWREKKLHREKQ